jgi:hypothetical protein
MLLGVVAAETSLDFTARSFSFSLSPVGQLLSFQIRTPAGQQEYISQDTIWFLQTKPQGQDQWISPSSVGLLPGSKLVLAVDFAWTCGTTGGGETSRNTLRRSNVTLSLQSVAVALGPRSTDVFKVAVQAVEGDVIDEVRFGQIGWWLKGSPILSSSPLSRLW